ncbi:MAG: phosphate-starvation-inducible PsiE family protein [Candidatus Thiothrix putei]|uniref:Protein PsiE n=1 Tax=Candidatus Thiothrix putei TaxID=3080811 RepID=A0AA95HJ03_9GAMM|nr:MAG: phosphate-starvation-inducible PsiE family protein [Candidatus Thiothrix putei]
MGDLAVEAFHVLGLFVIGGTIVWSAAHAYLVDIMQKPYASLDDILLLFIYLELGAMVGIFFRTHRLPVILKIS